MDQPKPAPDIGCNCGDRMVAIETEHVSHWGEEGAYVRVTGVPAWKCYRCGQVVFDHDVSLRLEALVRAGMDGADRVEPLALKRYPLRGRTNSAARDRNRAPTRN